LYPLTGGRVWVRRADRQAYSVSPILFFTGLPAMPDP